MCGRFAGFLPAEAIARIFGTGTRWGILLCGVGSDGFCNGPFLWAYATSAY
jgi:hypothetical protein